MRRPHILTLLSFCAISVSAGWTYEGTPAPGILNGRTFTGTVTKTVPQDSKPVTIKCESKCKSGIFASTWFKSLGFDDMTWESGEISGSSKEMSLFIILSAKNNAGDTLRMHIKVLDLRDLSAQAKLSKPNGTVEEYSISAKLKDDGEKRP